ncbi:MAG TPA: LPS assembly lipoprotein LptE [Gammaproteobacteria bacterium]|nr:LPS assembly lipoprotein LptE [Gammaproteobacteria bacterium]
MAPFPRLLLALSLAVTLSACGYHLQRTRNLPPVMQRTLIVGADPYGDLTRELIRALSSANVTVVKTPDRATAQLHILTDSSDQTVVSVDSHDRPQAYELQYTVKFSVTHDKQTWLAPQTVSLNRTYVFDPDNVLAGNQEARRLLQAMRGDLVQVILRRLAAIKPPVRAAEKPVQKSP